MVKDFDYYIQSYILPFVRGILMGLGVILILAFIFDFFKKEPENCRNGYEMSFPIDHECVVEMNVGGKNYGWTLKPYSDNSKKSR